MEMHCYSCSKFRKLREIPSEGFQFLSEVENVPTDGHMGVHKRSKIFLRKTGIEREWIRKTYGTLLFCPI